MADVGLSLPVEGRLFSLESTLCVRDLLPGLRGFIRQHLFILSCTHTPVSPASTLLIAHVYATISLASLHSKHASVRPFVSPVWMHPGASMHKNVDM